MVNNINVTVLEKHLKKNLKLQTALFRASTKTAKVLVFVCFYSCPCVDGKFGKQVISLWWISMIHI